MDIKNLNELPTAIIKVENDPQIDTDFKFDIAEVKHEYTDIIEPSELQIKLETAGEFSQLLEINPADLNIEAEAEDEHDVVTPLVVKLEQIDNVETNSSISLISQIKTHVIKAEKPRLRRKIKSQTKTLKSRSQKCKSARTGEKLFKCNDCEFTTAWKRSLQMHASKHKKLSVSDVCGYKIASKLKLQNVCNFDVEYRTRIPLGVRYYACMECPRKCRSRRLLQEHMSVHTGEKPFKCVECEFRTAALQRLRQHMMTHSGKKTYKCTDCDYSSVYKRDLREHLMTHTGEKPFECSKCKFKTALKRNLQRHVKIHTGEKPFECYLCGYRAGRKHHLQQHIMLNHTDERPYVCFICGCRYGMKHHLEMHVVSHNKGK